MSLLDLFTGHWTIRKLFGELAPIIVAALAAYFAGFQRGRRIEHRLGMKTFEPQLARLEQMAKERAK